MTLNLEKSTNIRIYFRIAEALNVHIQVGDFITDIFRAIRLHIHKFLKVTDEVLTKSQLGLGHSYSRMKCMFDVNRQDKPVVQSIALIDQLDKNINSFCMRIKEWFGWHFPELNRIVADNSAYVKIVNLIQVKIGLILPLIYRLETISLKILTNCPHKLKKSWTTLIWPST